MSKNRKNKLVPKLRFTLSDGSVFPEWQNVKLSQVAELVTKKNRNNSITRVLTNSASEGIVDQRDYFDKDIANKSNLDSYYIVDYGDYVYNPRISTIAPVGPISKNKIAKGVMSPLYTVFRFTDNTNDFFEHYFKTTHWHQFLRSYSNSGARHDRMSITPTVFMEMKLPYPDINEQQKIADCLSSLDKLITMESKKLEALKAHKKGLMQNLFPNAGDTEPKIRFPEFIASGEWIEKSLGQLIDIKGRIGYRGYTTEDIVKKGGGAITLSPSNFDGYGSLTFENSTYISWEKYEESPEIMLREGFTVLVKTGSSYGKTAFVNNLPEKCTINPQIVVLKPTNIDAQFLYALVSHDIVQKKIKATVVGGAIPTLSQENISKFQVLVPKKSEQQKIAACLSSLDCLINTQTEKIASLKMHKKGLTQHLFPPPNNIES